MNITLSANKELIEKARAIAARQGMSLNDLVRRHLEMITGVSARAAIGQRLVAHMKKNSGTSAGKKLRREDAYEGRV